MRLLLFFLVLNNSNIPIMQDMIYCRSDDLCVVVLKAVPMLQISSLMVYSMASIDSKSASVCLVICVPLISSTTK